MSFVSGGFHFMDQEGHRTLVLRVVIGGFVVVCPFEFLGRYESVFGAV
jgi:hypothetical protein